MTKGQTGRTSKKKRRNYGSPQNNPKKRAVFQEDI